MRSFDLKSGVPGRKMGGTKHVKRRNKAMPYAILEEKIAGISPKYQDELVAFIDFLLFKQAGETMPTAPAATGAVSRKLGGYEKGYRMAADFDEPLADFAEYT